MAVSTAGARPNYYIFRMLAHSPRHKAGLSASLRGIKARKSLGQNFLVDTVIRDKIIEAASLQHSDLVIEVGPGAGALTDELAARAGRVVAIELDADLAGKLKKKLSRFGNLEIIHADILKLKLDDLLKCESSYKVVANIPYYITSPLLHYFAHAFTRPSSMVIMMQKEVAEDVIAAKSRMSYLAVAMQLYYDVEKICLVTSSSFFPPPKVDSMVARFRLLSEPALKLRDLAQFLTIVHAGFAAPRKQLRNSLALGLKVDTSTATEMLQKAGIDSSRRPENLTLPEWGRLYNTAKQDKVSEL